jgi:hypothetical protein
MLDIFTETFKSKSKSIEYIQSRLRSASDIFKKGGHVTMVYKDQQFRMHFDNKRVIEESLNGEVLLDSKPLKSMKHGENLRTISKIPKLKQYSRFSNFESKVTRYNKTEDLAIINFVKGLVSEPPMFNLHRVGLEKNKNIINLLKEYNPSIKLTEESISNLKRRSIKLKSVPRIKQTEDFVTFIAKKFKEFDKESFYRVY